MFFDRYGNPTGAGLVLYALGVFISVAAGVDIVWSIVVSAVVLLAYTFFGGLWAVAVTDFVQVYWHAWSFPAFNVADSSITVGAVLLIAFGLSGGRHAA